MLQFSFLDQSVSWKLRRVQMSDPAYHYTTINIVDFKEELDFVIWRLSRKPVHSIDELLKGNRSAVILVKNLEHSLHKERLQYIMCLVGYATSRNDIDIFVFGKLSCQQLLKMT